MCQQLIRIFILLLCTADLAAQPNGVVVGGKWADQVSISDVNGQPFKNKYDAVNGTPYFDAAYKYATILLSDGKKFVNIQVKLDLVEQETHFITANNQEAFAGKGIIKEISYADTMNTGIKLYKFQTGFPRVDRQTEINFYQVLAEGRCSFLKSITKSIEEKKNELSGEIAKDIETTENYYLFTKNEMKRLKKDKAFILSQLADKQAEINQFIQSNKINYKNTDDLIKLFNFYNSL